MATATAFACPSCGFAQHPSNAKCIKCGLQLNAPAASVSDADESVPRPPLSKEAKRALAIGFVLALVLHKVAFFGILFHPFITIVHELGHTVTGWLFGFPSIPSFDFSEGGGVTISNEDQDVLGAFIVYAIFAALLWKTRRHRPTTIVLILLIPIYSYIFFTHWHGALILVAGHGAELLMASIFLNRAMTGTSLLQADERPAYAMIGFYVLFYDFGFFWQLANDASFRDWYDVGKSYADNDLVVLIQEHVHSTLIACGNVFVVGCFAAFILAWLAYHFEGEIGRWASNAFLPAKDQI